MSVQPWWSRTGVIGAGVVLAAALGIWQAARLSDALGFGPRSTAAGREAGAAQAAGAANAEAGSPGREGGPGSDGRGGAAQAGAAGAPGGAAAGGAFSEGIAAHDGEPRTEAEREAAERLQGEMSRLVSDLEFTSGRREPPQQTVVKAPAPWTPPPDAGTLPEPTIEAVTPHRAPAAGGVQVVIRGQHLRVSQVMFGSRAARIVAASGEAVTVEVPAGKPGQVTIALTNADGSWALAGQPFTYLE